MNINLNVSIITTWLDELTDIEEDGQENENPLVDFEVAEDCDNDAFSWHNHTMWDNLEDKDYGTECGPDNTGLPQGNVDQTPGVMMK